MAYEVAYFTSFTLPRVELKVVQSAYVAWLLGFGRYERLRDRRREIGIDWRWNAANVLAAKNLQGRDDFELDSRGTDGAWLLRYRHRDTGDRAIFFQHQVRLQKRDDSVVVEHGLRRSAPRELLKPMDRPSRPRIVEDLVKKNPSARPLNLDRDIIRLPVDDVDDFVANVLFDAGSVPSVIVSPDEGTGNPLVDPAELAMWLRGMAVVAVLTSTDASWALTNSLKKRGLGDELRCFGGAIRAYNFEKAARLPFIMPFQLQELPAEARTRAAANELARRLAVRTMPQSFFSLIEEEDHRERTRFVENLKRQVIEGTESASQLKADLNELQRRLADADAGARRLEAENADLLEEAIDMEVARDAAREHLQNETFKWTAEVRRLKDENALLREQSKVVRLPPDFLEAVTSALEGPLTPLETVLLLERLFPERVTFLDTAKTSAKKAEVFRYRAKVAQLLVSLVTKYYDAVASGKGDVEARKVFGDEFAAKEAKLSKRGIKLRTFTWKGREFVMEKHLKDGVKQSDAECLRIHFEWMPDEKRIVVGHCGGHLDL